MKSQSACFFLVLRCICVCLAASDFVQLHEQCPWNFPGKSTGVGCHFLLQGIFPTQGWNPCLLHCQANSLPLCDLGSPPRGKESKRIGKIYG